MTSFRGLSKAERPIHPRPAEFFCSVLLLLAIAGLLVSAMLAIMAGPAPLSPSTVLSAIFRFDGSRDHLVVTLLRLPRVAAAMIAGAGLAVSGAIMQAVTKTLWLRRGSSASMPARLLQSSPACRSRAFRATRWSGMPLAARLSLRSAFSSSVLSAVWARPR